MGREKARRRYALPEREVDALMGIGGTPEAVLSAATVHCIGGMIQCTAWPRDRSERDTAIAKGIDGHGVHRKNEAAQQHAGKQRELADLHGLELGTYRTSISTHARHYER